MVQYSSDPGRMVQLSGGTLVTFDRRGMLTVYGETAVQLDELIERGLVRGLVRDVVRLTDPADKARVANLPPDDAPDAVDPEGEVEETAGKPRARGRRGSGHGQNHG